MKRLRHTNPKHAGQVVIEYVLCLTIVVVLAKATSIFYQGFVHGNLYGHAEERNGFFLLDENAQNQGLQRIVGSIAL